MKLTAHDRIPIGKAKAASLIIDDPQAAPDELRQWAEHYILNPDVVRKFIKRHPEVADWPPHDICRQVWHNRDRKYRAARQGVNSGSFQTIIYRREDIDYQPVTQREYEARFGLGKGVLGQFLRRHPECKAWPLERACKQIIANRDQSSVARRQQRKGKQGFKAINYEANSA